MLTTVEVGNLVRRHRVCSLEDVQFSLYDHRLGSIEIEAVVLELHCFSGHPVQQHDALGELVAFREREGKHLW